MKYCIVDYCAVNGICSWCIVKAPINMSDNDIKTKLLEDSNVKEVHTVIPTNNNDFDLDLT
jgi:hypothetical protein